MSVVYQIYVRSFADSNGDGVGDLPGVTSRLDYLQWLGIDTLWLSPTFPSPNVDWGYDVSDYLDVHPELGTLADLDALIAAARARGIDVWLDLVPNHTSDRHAWFTDRPEFYVWSDHIPNDWRSIFTGDTAWNYDARRKRYYLHQFAPEQPDLDWWNPDVRDEFDRILRFWFDRGVAGFRVDVAHGLIKDRELRDGVRYMRERPEVHEIFERWQTVAREYDPKPTLMGETYVPLSKLAAYEQHLDLVQNFPFVNAEFEVDELRPIVEAVERSFRAPLWFGVESRPLAARDTLGRRRRAEGSRGALPAADAARDDRALPGRRDRARRTGPCRRSACSTSPSRRATRSGRRCRGPPPETSGANRGCRSRTRVATSTISAPILRARLPTCAT